MALMCCAFALNSLGATGVASPDKTVHMRLFAHGDASAGEAQLHQTVAGSYMPMDEQRPTSDVPKSVGLTNAGSVPNPNCAGSPYYPVWVGEVGGRIRGDVVFDFHVVSSPGGKVEVRVWPDMEVMGCDEDYREPFALARVRLPEGSGKVSAVMEDVDFEAASNVMVQVTPSVSGVTQGRILYDSRQTKTALSFDCVPLWGDTCEPYE